LKSGDGVSLRFLFAKNRLNECYGDFSIVTPDLEARGRKRTSLSARFAPKSARRLARINSIDRLRGLGAGDPEFERGLLTSFQCPLGIEKAIELDGLGHESGPAGLVAGTQPGTVVAMEVFVE